MAASSTVGVEKMASNNEDLDVHQDSTGRICESRQLLYPDKFGECYKEEKLQIIGNKKCPPTVLKTQKFPQSSVLSQIKAFLPELSKANVSMAKDLESKPELADSINIECVENDEEDQHIEMNLSLVPSELLVDSDESSDDSSSDDDSNVEEKPANCDSAEMTESSTLPQMPEPTRSNSSNDRLRLPKSCRKTKKHGNALIEEVESKCDNFTNR